MCIRDSLYIGFLSKPSKASGLKEKEEMRISGEPMFAKGANFIPDDALLPNITEERYRQLFKDVKDANMNMIRVWGCLLYTSRCV